MNTLLESKEKFLKIYQDFESYFKAAAKFVFALLTLNAITGSIGYFDVLNIMTIRLFIAVVCAFIPVPMVVFVMAAVILLHLFSLSIVLAAVALVVFILMYLLYLKFAPGHGIYMLAVVALMPFHLEFAVPLISGLFFSPVTLIPVALGLFTADFLESVKAAASSLGDSFEIDAILTAYQSMVDQLMGNREMMLYIITFAAVIVLVYVVKKLPFDYSWYAAIASGAVLNILMLLAGGSMLGIDIAPAGVILGTLVSAVVTAAVQFFKCTVDYKSKEFVQFEDDDYYYYVKAIPKTGGRIKDSQSKKAVSSANVKKKISGDSEQEQFSEADMSENPELTGRPAAKQKSPAPEPVNQPQVSDETKVFKESILPKSDRKKTDSAPAVRRERPLDVSDKTQTLIEDDFSSFDDFDFSSFDDEESKF